VENIYDLIKLMGKVGCCRFLLQQLVHGRIGKELYEQPATLDDPEVQQEWEDFLSGFKSLTIDINRSRKGTRSMGIETFSAMVVAGNMQVPALLLLLLSLLLSLRHFHYATCTPCLA
jgi:hypothetical protein